MDSLRIVLIIAGVAIVAGIYLWERRRRTRRDEGRPPEALEEFAVEGFSAKAAPVEAWEGSGFTAGDAPAHEPFIPVLDAVIEEGRHAGEGDDGGAPAGDVLVLTVIADLPLPGRQVIDALVAAGLVHGRMAIFHYYPDAEGVDDEPWFSAANALEPGTFDLTAITALETPGVAFFAQLPAAADGEAVWERMLAAARAVAGRLGAAIGDEKRRPLSDTQLDALAARARRFTAVHERV